MTDDERLELMAMARHYYMWAICFRAVGLLLFILSGIDFVFSRNARAAIEFGLCIVSDTLSFFLNRRGDYYHARYHADQDS
jgi:hypothetical protein